MEISQFGGGGGGGGGLSGKTLMVEVDTRRTVGGIRLEIFVQPTYT